MNILHFTIILLPFYLPTYSEWVSHSDNSMPRDDSMSAVGSWDGIIFIMGGFEMNQQQTQYDTKEQSFVHYQSSYIPDEDKNGNENKVFGEAQFWTQIDSNLYILDDSETHKLSVFNMETNSYEFFYTTPPDLSDGMGRACLTSYENWIFINGGITSEGVVKDETRKLNINKLDLGWQIPPQMQTGRRSHTCIIANNGILYSIGGTNGTLHASIEKISGQISAEDSGDTQWEYLNQELSNPVKGLRSFIYDTYIYIIGGHAMIDRKIIWYDTIHIIDTKTDSVTLSDMRLAFPTGFSAVIMVEGIMYSFGGGFGTKFITDNWQSQIEGTPSPIESTSPPAQNGTTVPMNATGFPNGTNDKLESPTYPDEKLESAVIVVVLVLMAAAVLICFLIFCGCCGSVDGKKGKRKDFKLTEDWKNENKHNDIEEDISYEISQ